MKQVSPILITGLSLVAIIIGLAALSFAFPYGRAITETPLSLYIATALLAGVIWMMLPWQIRRSNRAALKLLTIILIGLAMRAAMVFSVPVLEDDSYRYLWDGAVTARGIDPYKYAPADVTPEPVFAETEARNDDPDVTVLKTLAEQNAEPYRRINFPFVATIYPPLAQAAFAAAHWIDPFGLTGWRLVLLTADLVTLVLLLRLLRLVRRAPVWVSLYWWNPVVILQGFGAGHMDLLVLPFLVGALLLANHQRFVLAVLTLAGGAAIKLWPVLLFPIIARPLLQRPGKLLFVSILFGASVAALLLPQLLHVLRPEAGLNAYATEWRTHAFLFAIFEDVVFAAAPAPGHLARFSVAAITLGLTAYLALKYADDPNRLPSLMAGVIAILIFLSPTGYPWYFIWLAPFLPLVPSAALLALIVLAPLYWLRFQLGDQSLVYQWLIVPVAFGLPLFLFVRPHFSRSLRDAFRHHHPRPE